MNKDNNLKGKLFKCHKYNEIHILLEELHDYSEESDKQKAGYWALHGYWGGLKGYNPHNKDKRDLEYGYLDLDLHNQLNYYTVHRVPSNKNVLGQIKGMGYSELKDEPA